MVSVRTARVGGADRSGQLIDQTRSGRAKVVAVPSQLRRYIIGISIRAY